MSSSGLPSRLQVEHRRESAEAPARPTGSLSAEQAPEQIAEPAALVRKLRRVAGALLLRHQPGDDHREHRQHLLQQRGVESGLRRAVLRDRAAHVLRPEDLAEHVVAVVQVGPLRGKYFVEQAAAAELSEQAAEPVESRRLRLYLPLESAEDRRQQCFGAAGGLRFADAELARHGLKTAHLGKDVGELHADTFLDGSIGNGAPAAARARRARRVSGACPACPSLRRAGSRT
jgi:hypothetical protein